MPLENHPGRADRWAYALSAAMLLTVVGFRFATFADYGISWDEFFRVEAGANKSQYLRQVIAGERTLGDLTAEELADTYPGLFDITNWELSRLSGTDPLVTLHAWTQLWGLSALVAVWLIGWRLGGPWTGLACFLFLATAPRYWGHAGFNPKDIPFLTGYAWSLWWLLEALRPLPRVAIGRWLLAGLSAGLCAGTRLAGLVFVLFALAILGVSALRVVWRRWLATEPPAQGHLRTSLLTHLVAGAGSAICALLVLWPFFPPMHLSLESLLRSVAGPPWVGRVLFEGSQQLAGALPFYYLPKMLLISLPEGLLIGLVAGLPAAWRWVRRPSLATAKAQQAAPFVLLAVSFGFPAAYSMLMGRSQYDGMRHGLFLLVPLACLAATSLSAAIAHASRRWAAYGLIGLTVLGFGWNLAHLWSLHPYQYVYFNALVGYLPGADGRYEKDYWGLSLREAVDRLEDELGQVVEAPPIASMRPEFITEYYLRSSALRYSPGGVESTDAGFLIVLDRWEQPAVAARFGEPVPNLSVRRQGVELCRVLKRTPLSRAD